MYSSHATQLSDAYLKRRALNAEDKEAMTDPSVEIQVTIKVVDESYYEFSHPYGAVPLGQQPIAGVPGKVVQTGSSVIAPGLAIPVASR